MNLGGSGTDSPSGGVLHGRGFICLLWGLGPVLQHCQFTLRAVEGRAQKGVGSDGGRDVVQKTRAEGVPLGA